LGCVELEEIVNLNSDELAKRVRFSGFAGGSCVGACSARDHFEFVAAAVFPGWRVVDRKAVEGEVVDSKTALFEVADTSRLWLTLKPAAGRREICFAGADSSLSGRAKSTNEPDSKGTVAWISTDADDVTRTVEGARGSEECRRAVAETNTFGTGRIVLREEPKAVVISSDAIHWEWTCNVVFVRDKKLHAAECARSFSTCGACGRV